MDWIANRRKHVAISGRYKDEEVETVDGNEIISNSVMCYGVENSAVDRNAQKCRDG